MSSSASTLKTSIQNAKDKNTRKNPLRYAKAVKEICVAFGNVTNLIGRFSSKQPQVHKLLENFTNTALLWINDEKTKLHLPQVEPLNFSFGAIALLVKLRTQSYQAQDQDIEFEFETGTVSILGSSAAILKATCSPVDLKFTIELFVTSVMFMLCCNQNTTTLHCEFRAKKATTGELVRVFTMPWTVEGDANSDCKLNGIYVDPNDDVNMDTMQGILLQLTAENDQSQDQVCFAEACNTFCNFVIAGSILNESLQFSECQIAVGPFLLNLNIQDHHPKIQIDFQLNADTVCPSQYVKWDNILFLKKKRKKTGQSNTASSQQLVNLNSPAPAAPPQPQPINLTGTTKGKGKGKGKKANTKKQKKENEYDIGNRITKSKLEKLGRRKLYPSEFMSATIKYYFDTCPMTKDYIEKLSEINPTDDKYSVYFSTACAYVAMKIIFFEVESLEGFDFTIFSNLYKKKISDGTSTQNIHYLLEYLFFRQSDQFLSSDAQSKDEADRPRDGREKMFIEIQGWSQEYLGEFSKPKSNSLELHLPDYDTYASEFQIPEGAEYNKKEAMFFFLQSKLKTAELKKLVNSLFLRAATRIIEGAMKIRYGKKLIKSCNAIIDVPPDNRDKLEQEFAKSECQEVLDMMQKTMLKLRGGTVAPDAKVKKFKDALNNVPGHFKSGSLAKQYKETPKEIVGNYTGKRMNPYKVYDSFKEICTSIDERFKMFITAAKEQLNNTKKTAFPWFDCPNDILIQLIIKIQKVSKDENVWDIDAKHVKKLYEICEESDPALYWGKFDLDLALTQTQQFKMSEMLKFIMIQSVYHPAVLLLMSGHTLLSDSKLKEKAFTNLVVFDSGHAGNLLELLIRDKVITDRGDLMEENLEFGDDIDMNQNYESSDLDSDLYSDSNSKISAAYGYFMDPQIAGLIRTAMANLVI